MPDSYSKSQEPTHGGVWRALRYPAVAAHRLWRKWRYGPRIQVIENLRRLLAEDPVLCVAGYPGRFVVGRESDIFRRILVAGDYEPELVEVCRRHVDPRRDAIDVGANIGLYSILLADLLLSGRVLAIEPTANALQRLRRNIALNGREASVAVFPGAAAATDTTVAISTVPGREEYSTAGLLGHPSISGASFETYQVAARTIDNLVAEHALKPGFVKIDVEGMEHTVLAGMHATMEAYKPVILAELSDPLLRNNGSSAAEVLAEIRRHGYLISDPIHADREPGSHPYGDILCVPR
jgi:FkbM family methyltransferase